MKDAEDRLESLVKRDMERRNRKEGFRMFEYEGTAVDGAYVWIWYLYRPDEHTDPVRVSYGGYPYKSRKWLYKEYLEECLHEEIRGPWVWDRSTSEYENWFTRRGW